MGKKKKTATSGSWDPQRLEEYVDRVEEEQGEIDKIGQQAKDDQQPHRQSIAAIKKDASKTDHIPIKEFNAALRRRRLLEKAEAVRDTLSPEQQDNYDKMLHALGMLEDTPLGQAAARRAAAEEGGAATH